MKRKQSYGNDSISALKGADRVRKRPAVIFGSDGLEGCEHAVGLGPRRPRGLYRDGADVQGVAGFLRAVRRRQV